MRGVLVGLLLVASLVAVAPTAEAHWETCEMGDMECWLVCRAKHLTADASDHGCRWNVHPPP